MKWATIKTFGWELSECRFMAFASKLKFIVLSMFFDCYGSVFRFVLDIFFLTLSVRLFCSTASIQRRKKKKNWGNARRIGWTCSEHFRLFRLSQIVLLIMRSNFVQWFSPSGRMLQPDARIHSKVNVVWTRVEVRSDELHEWKWDRIYCQR